MLSVTEKAALITLARRKSPGKLHQDLLSKGGILVSEPSQHLAQAIVDPKSIQLEASEAGYLHDIYVFALGRPPTIPEGYPL